ncbi:uncharacterized protein SPSK_02083 [Sporothrix schenckii 1099-18]|uniref:Uncharacterized protein n=1 Tax=Sporothrix schenckii 1099-18 TaxID=1397361 RepID=A0A0F2MBN0_SPOSC|nr:uncharacterized protein SPSK_02083 [Sporothrix schenckii 1099-18]KJR87108.1 hypothetical protein SPSK_02083 [Sporothrix schenckii 1099-18]
MGQKEVLGTAEVKAVKRVRLLQILLLCLSVTVNVVVAVVVLVVVVGFMKVEEIAPGASCTKCREATIALEARVQALGPCNRMTTEDELRGS